MATSARAWQGGLPPAYGGEVWEEWAREIFEREIRVMVD